MKMKKYAKKGICTTLLFILVITIFSSIVPASAETSQVLSLSDDFMMITVGYGANVPLTASQSNVNWSSTNPDVAQYNASIQCVCAGLKGGYTAIQAELNGTYALCDVIGVYNGYNITNGIYYIQSDYNSKFVTNSTTLRHNDFNKGIQQWTILPTDDGYYRIQSAITQLYIGVEINDGSPTIIHTNILTNDNTKWIIKAVKNDDVNRIKYIIMPKELSSDGYMLAITNRNDVSGGDLSIMRYNASLASSFYWIFHNINDYKGAIPSWNTDLSTPFFHSGDIKTYYFLYLGSTTNNYNTLQSNFYYGSYIAEGQWETALDVNIATDSLNANTDIVCYGVTRESYLQLTGKTWDNDRAGYTVLTGEDIYIGYYVSQERNQRIDVYEKTTLVSMYILLDLNESRVNAICTHELGHALGFTDHSSNSNHIMYPNLRYINGEIDAYDYLLTAEEAHDLKVIYDRYN